MKISKSILLISLVCLLAAVLRFYQLGTVPHGMAWDEAAIAYNGYAIFTTRRDEWLQKLPLSFRSFGDYKAPLAIYLSAFFTHFFGMNLWAVRLPFALAGVLAVLGIYWLVKELFWQEKKSEQLAILAAFLLAISPWHLHYSRLAFESGLALSFLIWSLFFFYRYLRLQRWLTLLLAVAAASAAIYVYHSSKIVIPLLFLVLLLNGRAIIFKHLKHAILAIATGALLLGPLLYDSFFGPGLTRINTSLFAQGLTWPALLNTIIKQALSYFSLAFLTQGANGDNLRHSDGVFGVLYWPSLLLIVFYLLMLAYRLFKKKYHIALSKTEASALTLAISLIIVGLLPAIIAKGATNSNRALLALPGYLLLLVLAWRQLTLLLRHKLYLLVSILILASCFLSLVFYQKHYYQVYSRSSATAFADGYLETFEYLRNLDKHNIQQIIFTTDYGQAYIYALFVFKISPIAYQGGLLNLFFFTDKIDNNDLAKAQTIVVASKDKQLTARPADQIIYGSDGQARFFIYLPL